MRILKNQSNNVNISYIKSYQNVIHNILMNNVTTIILNKKKSMANVGNSN